MATFIKLSAVVFASDTPAEAETVYINVDHIVMFSRPSSSELGHSGITMLGLSIDNSGDNISSSGVRETPEQILALIQAAKES